MITSPALGFTGGVYITFSSSGFSIISLDVLGFSEVVETMYTLLVEPPPYNFGSEGALIVSLLTTILSERENISVRFSVFPTTSQNVKLKAVQNHA